MTKSEKKRKKNALQHKLVKGGIGVLIALILYVLVPGDQYEKAPLMAAVVGLMAAWWVMEVIPIGLTSLIPIVVLPFLGIGSFMEFLPYYYKEMIFLFLGGYLLALGLQASDLHNRIALYVVLKIGSTPSRLILGFMLTTGFLSMWIANTASVVVMLPIGMSILEGVQRVSNDNKFVKRFGIALMLGIAYAADIGGMATLVGTPPNIVFAENYSTLFPEAPAIGFVDWMVLCMPFSVIFLFLGWLFMTRVVIRMPRTKIYEDNSAIRKKLEALGKMTRDEKFAGLIFGSAAVLWLTGSDIQLSDNFTFHGWRYWLGLEAISDAIVAMICAVLLFLVPSSEKKGKMLLPFKTYKQIPVGILLLFGGGFAIAGGFKMSGLDEVIKQIFESMPELAPMLIVGIICLIVTFLTELTSNTAITNLILPILASATVVLDMDPRLMMIPATLSASCAFMMPIASPTQAIAYGSGYVTIPEMMRTGVWFNLLGVLIVTVFFAIVTTFVW
ncbi:MAG: SLC13 family permease [Crocinitomicaceae bacterium]|nr:SLC13 family permease [Crocinitomicaceae bacterium]